MSTKSNIDDLLGELDKAINEMPKGTLQGSFDNDVPYIYFWEVGFNIYRNGKSVKYFPPESMLRVYANKTIDQNFNKIARRNTPLTKYMSYSNIKETIQNTLDLGMETAIAHTRRGSSGVMALGGSNYREYKPNHVKDLGYPEHAMYDFRGWEMNDIKLKSSD